MIRNFKKYLFIFALLINTNIQAAEHVNNQSNSNVNDDSNKNKSAQLKDNFIKDNVAYKNDIKKYLMGIFQKIQALSSSKNTERISILMNNNLNFEYISHFVLGNYLRNITAENLKSFQTVYKNFLLKSYTEKLELVAEGTLDIQRVDRDENDANTFFAIAQFTDKDNQIIDIIIMVNKVKNDFLISDIVIENISIIMNHRAEFANVIESQGFDALIEQLKNL